MSDRETVFERQGRRMLVRIRGVSSPIYGTTYAPRDDEHARLRAWGLGRVAAIPREEVESVELLGNDITLAEVRSISAEQRARCGRELGRWLEE